MGDSSSNTCLEDTSDRTGNKVLITVIIKGRTPTTLTREDIVFLNFNSYPDGNG